uniref:Putative secreted protein n=1 Tax=Anopheles marajoara TaxID=58244 RepID=A0A2M4C6X4_9DIPT
MVRYHYPVASVLQLAAVAAQPTEPEALPPGGFVRPAQGVDRFGAGRLPRVSFGGGRGGRVRYPEMMVSGGVPVPAFRRFLVARWKDKVGLGTDPAVSSGSVRRCVHDLTLRQCPLVATLDGRFQGGRTASVSTDTTTTKTTAAHGATK